MPMSKIPNTVFSVVSMVCFSVLVVCTLALGLWLLAAFAVSGSLVSVRLITFSLQLLSLILYFRWPWLAAIIAWLNIGLALTRVFP
jgi:hypothetical protein